MRGVTEPGGTAKAAAIDGYPVAGKTGTAQKVANGHYDPSKAIASFVGVVPANDPRLVILVVLDEPQGSHMGGAVAAPIFKEIAEEALRYLHVAPTTLVASGGKSGARAGKEAAAAKSKAAAHDAGDEAVADNAAESAANEAAPTDAPLEDDNLSDDPALADKWDEVAGAERGRHGDATGEHIMIPDFVGMSLGQAIHAAHRSGIELAFDDPEGSATGVALRQRPSAGPAPRGSTVHLFVGARP
jgi:hypothetical protein